MVRWQLVLCLLLSLYNQVKPQEVISTKKLVKKSDSYDLRPNEKVYKWHTDGAVDGEMITCSRIRSESNTRPWWVVDLLHTQSIIMVSVTFPEMFWDKKSLFGAEVLVGNDDQLDFRNYKKCGTLQSGNYTNYKTKFIKCTDGPIQGRYVAVLGADKGAEKKLCEVQVFRESSAKTNLALGQQASQSSTIKDSIASRAVDGNRNPNSNSGSCAQTGTDKMAYWVVDLNTVYRIQSIRITGSSGTATDLYQSDIFITEVWDLNIISTNMMKTCATICNTTFNASTKVIEVILTKLTYGRYVAITKSPGKLSVCEFEVFGSPRPGVSTGTQYPKTMQRLDSHLTATGIISGSVGLVVGIVITGLAVFIYRMRTRMFIKGNQNKNIPSGNTDHENPEALASGKSTTTQNHPMQENTTTTRATICTENRHYENQDLIVGSQSQGTSVNNAPFRPENSPHPYIDVIVASEDSAINPANDRQFWDQEAESKPETAKDQNPYESLDGESRDMTTMEINNYESLNH